MKYPKSFRNQWKQVCEVTQRAVIQSKNELKSLGAWKAFILLPIMLLRTPAGVERDLHTNSKWARRFSKFWSGNFRNLVTEAIQSSRQNLQSNRHWTSNDTFAEDASTNMAIPISKIIRAEN